MSTTGRFVLLKCLQLLMLAGSLVLASCQTVGYYAHVTHGQAALLLHRRDIRKVIADPSTPLALVKRLQQVQQGRQFATRRLGLPDNRSYTRYVQLHRPYVVWNVFAAPRYSVDAVEQCFPIAGCVAYRGYFDESKAQADAARLHARGEDVDIGGVAAYSTLGWFADPVLSSMLRWDDDELVGTIFHELAHQLIYAKGDTAFNESFATFVQQQGLQEWHVAQGKRARGNEAERMDDEFTALALDLRARLRRLYSTALFESGTDQQAMAAAKQHEFDAFRVRYQQWRATCWPNDHRYDAWVEGPLNNASLLGFGLYNQWVPAFTRLFQQTREQWADFYAQVRVLARLPAAEREHRLRDLMPSAARSKRGGGFSSNTLDSSGTCQFN